MPADERVDGRPEQLTRSERDAWTIGGLASRSANERLSAADISCGAPSAPGPLVTGVDDSKTSGAPSPDHDASNQRLRSDPRPLAAAPTAMTGGVLGTRGAVQGHVDAAKKRIARDPRLRGGHGEGAAEHQPGQVGEASGTVGPVR